MSLEKAYVHYKNKATIYLVYIREAHPVDGWYSGGPKIKDPRTMEERSDVAGQCLSTLKFTIPCLVDGIDNAAEKAYAAYPDRIYVIDPAGKIAYKSGLGPWGFRPREMEVALQKVLGESGEPFVTPEDKPLRRGANKPRPPAEVIETFRQAWGNQPGVMRPLDDQGWKARVVALCELVRLGPKAIPALTAALGDKDAEVRALATQTFGFVGEASVADKAEQLLAKDPDPTVRMLLGRYSKLLPESVRNKGKFGGRAVVAEHGKMPHIRIHEVLIRGPLYDQWPPAGQQVVFGGKAFEAGRTREILEAFASRAYRRPARADEVDRLMAVVERRRKDGRSPHDALKDGLKAALCSPAFLYLAEPDPAAKGKALPAHALAARLSYFLWSTMPDAELAALAQTGELLKSEVLAAQTRRMLASPRSDAFVAAFLDSWLNLRSLGDMPPDRAAFERYYAQDLQSAMRRETQLFTRHLLDHNESIVRFLDADYTFVNRPLAKLYGMGDAVGVTDAHLFRRVKITNPNRGGLLGQGSVLTVTANGVETSPVTRGVWLLENILGTPPAPPPDDVPAIEPDVRGAKSMREILAKHRSDPACYECHRKIDPLGFALENFDPIGAWRSHYEIISETKFKEVKRVVGAPIDASGELPGGQSFKDIAGLRKILVERKDQFARTLTERLLSYACGRRIEPLDRPEVDRIGKELAGRGYGFKDLIELVALSKTFQSK